MLSGDSTVNSFVFDGVFLRFNYEDNDSDKIYEFVVKTPIVYSEVPYGIDCVHISIESSNDKLLVDEKSGLFILPADFSKQMNAFRNGYHVLAGLKASEFKLVFSVIGYGKLMVCPIENESSVSILEKNEYKKSY